MEQKQRRHGSSKAYANPTQKIQTLIDETDRKHRAEAVYPKRILAVGFTAQEITRTKKDVFAQIVAPTIAGDIVLACAYAHELPSLFSYLRSIVKVM
ncbi:hypothetical protein YC2023_063001 [Brassica napus]